MLKGSGLITSYSQREFDEQLKVTIQTRGSFGGDCLDKEDAKNYQTIIECIQCLLTLGRFDIQTTVMTPHSFQANPGQGHLY